MNKLIHTAPPSGLGRWLVRSVAWGAACIGGFAPVAYLFGSASRDDKASQLCFLIGLTLAQLLAWKKAVAGFGQAFSRGSPPASFFCKAISGLWFFLLLLVLLQAALFCAFGWLLLGDDGKNWSV